MNIEKAVVAMHVAADALVTAGTAKSRTIGIAKIAESPLPEHVGLWRSYRKALDAAPMPLAKTVAPPAPTAAATAVTKRVGELARQHGISEGKALLKLAESRDPIDRAAWQAFRAGT